MSSQADGVYLDHAASAPMRPEALEQMLPHLTESYGNPSGSHRLARAARRAIDDARDQVSALAGCDPGEVYFTSGGTEADVTALRGAAGATGAVAVSAIEHPAVLDSAAALAESGHDVWVMAVDSRAQIEIDADRLATFRPSVVSVAAANNELGTIQPLDELANTLNEISPNTILHTDAVQAALWLDLAVAAAPAQLISLSAHKLGGPKGVGALVIRKSTTITPLMHGGGQERGVRSGTQNVAGIVGFGAAAEAVRAEREDGRIRVGALRDSLATKLIEGIAPHVPDAFVTADRLGIDRSQLLPGHLHLCLPNVASDEVLFLLDQAGVAATSAASCSSGAAKPSHVLDAVGLSLLEAGGSLRFTLGWNTTAAELDQATDTIITTIANLCRATR